MKLEFYGHSACLLESGNNRILIDPFLRDNPLASILPEQVKCDYIILTHGHQDHFGDTIEIAKANDATIIATYELAQYCEMKGCKVVAMHIGGRAPFPFGSVKFTIAHHSSSITEEDGRIIYLGSAAGVLVSMEHQTVFHAGDTALFTDMKLIGEQNKIDLALVPIGDNFTMGVRDAVEAVAWLRPKKAVPVHYNTFPAIEADPRKFADLVNGIGVEAELMMPGETLEF